MSPPDDLTRKLLAPRGRSEPSDAGPASRNPPRRARWRIGAMVALLVGAAVAAAMIGQSLRQSVGSAPEPVATAEQREASPNRVAPAVPAPARQPEPTVNPAVPAIVATPAAPALTATPPPTPTTTPTSPARVADLDELLQAPPSTQLRWVRFKANRGIVVIEYPNLQEQGLAMNRLAAMFEKRTARRDRVPSDAELAALLRRSGDSVASFYQGHDYPAAKVARFFSLAETQRMILNARELQLRALVLEAGLMTRSPSGGFQAAGTQAVVSFTGVQPDDPATAADEQVDGVRREAVLRHELSHGEFFTNPAYRAHCIEFWRQGLREPERRLFSAYLKGLDYNPSDEELMANETQALLMHTPDGRAFNAANLGIGEAALAQLKARFSAGQATNATKR